MTASASFAALMLQPAALLSSMFNYGGKTKKQRRQSKRNAAHQFIFYIVSIMLKAWNYACNGAQWVVNLIVEFFYLFFVAVAQVVRSAFHKLA